MVISLIAAGDLQERLAAATQFKALLDGLARQAEAMTAARAVRSRRHRLGADSWTESDDRLYAAFLADLGMAHLERFSALLRRIAR